jgi:hypothetical protein
MKITGKLITIIGFSVLVIYVITQIFKFYGITPDYYGIYLCFYIFLFVCIIIFPNKYESVI